MTIPIIFHYDYKMKAELNLDIDRFEEHFGNMIFDLKRVSDPNVSYLDVEFSSEKDIGKIRKELQKMLDYDDCTLLYETLDYFENYTGDKYFKYHIKDQNRLQCDYCNKSEQAEIPEGERLPCCKKCLCSCIDFEHKGGDVDTRVIKVGNTTFRVCKECVSNFTM